MKQCIYIILASVCLFSCYQNQEGCLDVYASNYSLIADDACEDCCTYPSLSLNIRTRKGDTFFKAGDTLSDIRGKSYRLLSMSYLLSDIVLEAPDSLVHVRNMVTLVSDTSVVDDSTPINPSLLSFTIGNIRYEGSIPNIRYRQGAAPRFMEIGYPSTHRMEMFKDTFLRDGSYFSAMATIARGSEYQDTIRIYGKNHDKSKTLALDTMSTRGKNLTLKMNIDIEKSLKDIDIYKASSYEVLNELDIQLTKS